MYELENPIEFAFAGDAVLTLESENTNNRFTYKIQKSDKDDNLFYIKLLRGQDNNNDYSYIGCYFADSKYFHPCTKWKDVTKEYWPPSLRAIEYFLRNIDKIPPKLHVYHEGRCGKCGRRLTTPESIKRGFGPECCRL